MEYDQIILLQKRFIRLHRLLFAVLLIYSGIQFIEVAQSIYIYLPLGMLVVMLMEAVIFGAKPVKLKWLAVVKYIHILTMTVLTSIACSRYFMGIGLLCLVLFEAELFLTIDFTDEYVRKIFLALINIPALIGVITVSQTVRGKHDFYTFEFLVVWFLEIALIKVFTDIFSSVIEENEEKVFAQTRLIERINETNDELRIHQEKVKSTNELLGVQKIELQSAYVKINNVNEEMRIQNEILKLISSSLDMDKLMNFITESFVKRIGMDVCAIVLKQGTMSNKKILYKINTVLGGSFEESLAKSIEDNCFEPLILNNKIYCDNQVIGEKYDFLSESSIQSLLILPLIKQEQHMGVLFLGHRRKDVFGDNLEFFEGIVSQFLIGLNNANLYQEMQSMAILDGLTGIYNRRHLTKLFNQYMYESITNRAPLSAALFDIDFFKKINDTYGHLFGDEIIKTIASLAKTISNEYGGIAARYGGEEFVIIFPNKGLEEAYPAVEKLHREVKKLDIMHHGKKVTVNVSVGFTSFPKTCKDPRELLNRADWSMYYSKQHGRDQITIDSDEIQKEVLLE